MKTISRTTWNYLLQETLLILLLTYFLLFTGTSGVLSSHELFTGAAILFFSLCVAWLVAGQRAAIPLARPLLLFMAAFLLSTLFSIDPRRSLSQFILTMAGLTLFAFAAETVARGWPAELWIKCLLIAGAFLMLTVWFDFFAWYRGWLQAEPGQWLPRIIYRPSKANILAFAANTLFFLSAVRLLFTRAWLSRFILALYSLSAIFIVYLTSSRGAWLGAAAGFAALILLLVYRERARLLRGWAWLRRQPAVMILSGALLLALLPTVYLLVTRQLNHPTHPAFWQARSNLWGPAWQTFLKHPIFGQGPYTYASAFMTTVSAPPQDVFYHGHSTPLNLLTEMGLVGFAAFAYLLISLVRVLKCRLDTAIGLDLSVVLGVILAATALAVQSIFDCFHTEPVAIMGLLVALGAALPSPPLGVSLEKDRGKGGLITRRPFWLILVAALVFFEVWSTAPLARGVEFANSGNWPAAVSALTLAAHRDPGSVIAHQQLALAQSVLASQQASSPEGEVRGSALDLAITAMRRAVALDPAYAPNHLNLGALLFSTGDPLAARAEFQAAVDRAPSWGLAHLNLGLANEALGDELAATTAYTAALADPSLSPAPFWQTTPLRAGVSAAWLTRQASSAEVGLASLRAQADSFPQTTGFYIALAAAELDAGDPAAARRALQLARGTWSTHPAEHLELAWLDAAITAAAGNLATAARLGDAALQSALAQGVYGPGSFGNLVYAPFEFRRPAMALELVPQLTTIPLTDTWAARGDTLAGWYAALGLADKAASIRQTVMP